MSCVSLVRLRHEREGYVILAYPFSDGVKRSQSRKRAGSALKNGTEFTKIEEE